MPSIDYSKLHAPKKPPTHGHSVEGSFYLQKTKEIAGRYKPYHKYVICGMAMTVVDKEEASQPEDNKE